VVLGRTREGALAPVVAPARPPRRETTRSAADVTVGELLGPWRIPVTQLSIAALATATFDFNDVHLDRDAALERGAPDVYMNILGSSALVNCFLTDWAGPEAELRALDVRLRRQNHPGDALTLVGTITGCSPEGEQAQVTVDVRGYNSLGDHLTGSAVVAVPNA
jgi:acyl dehydratase